MRSNPAEIGERIKAARRAANLSQTELAKRLDKTMRTIQKYESGEIEPSIAMINAIAKVLDVSPPAHSRCTPCGTPRCWGYRYYST